jgi:Na+/H+ antiporter NhaA
VISTEVPKSLKIFYIKISVNTEVSIILIIYIYCTIFMNLLTITKIELYIVLLYLLGSNSIIKSIVISYYGLLGRGKILNFL